MTPMPDSQAWRQLGEELQRRRAQLDPRYANLERFATERGINYRVAWDVEHGARDNYRRPTLRAIEVAYGVPMRFIDDFLDAARSSATQSQPGIPPDYGDPQKNALAAWVWEQNRDEKGPVFDEDVLRGVVEFLWRKQVQDTPVPSVPEGAQRRIAG